MTKLPTSQKQVEHYPLQEVIERILELQVVRQLTSGNSRRLIREAFELARMNGVLELCHPIEVLNSIASGLLEEDKATFEVTSDEMKMARDTAEENAREQGII